MCILDDDFCDWNVIQEGLRAEGNAEKSMPEAFFT